MSLQFRIADQVLKVDDRRDATDAVVHKYDAYLNLLCADRFVFQRDAVRETLRFLVSDILSTFPLGAEETKTAALKAFRAAPEV